MKALRQGWRTLAERFDARAPRERMLLALTLVGGTLLLGNALFVDPTLAESRALQQRIEQQRAEARTLTASVADLANQVRNDPDAPKRERLARLRAELAGLDAELEALSTSFVPPERMSDLLEQLLAGYPRLRLVGLKSLPPVPLAGDGVLAGGVAAVVDTLRGAIGGSGSGTPQRAGKPQGQEAGAAEEAALFRHGLELEVEGSYADLYAWLAQIEAGPQKMLWGDARFTVIEHPRARLVLTVHTLNKGRAWLAI
ncbi:MAG: type II secretion system protein M [Rhodocyclaceae bacterium]|nr:type II secretion system protein M [Rhodocyclaceae bacterium]